MLDSPERLDKCCRMCSASRWLENVLELRREVGDVTISATTVLETMESTRAFPVLNESFGTCRRLIVSFHSDLRHAEYGLNSFKIGSSNYNALDGIT